jgi:hypothetical protein
MHKIKEMLMDELYQYEEKAKKMNGGKLSAGDLETLHKLTDTVKNIDKIEMLEDGGDYSERTDFMGEGRMYGVSRDSGTSYARRGNVRRDSKGRYSREGGSSYAMREHGYSYEGAEHLMDKAEELLETAENEKQRQAIHRFMKELERI